MGRREAGDRTGGRIEGSQGQELLGEFEIVVEHPSDRVRTSGSLHLNLKSTFQVLIGSGPVGESGKVD